MKRQFTIIANPHPNDEFITSTVNNYGNLPYNKLIFFTPGEIGTPSEGYQIEMLLVPTTFPTAP